MPQWFITGLLTVYVLWTLVMIFAWLIFFIVPRAKINSLVPTAAWVVATVFVVAYIKR